MKVLLRTALLEQFRQTSHSSTPKGHTPAWKSVCSLPICPFKNVATVFVAGLLQVGRWPAFVSTTTSELFTTAGSAPPGCSFQLSPQKKTPIIAKDHNKSKNVKLNLSTVLRRVESGRSGDKDQSLRLQPWPHPPEPKTTKCSGAAEIKS